MTVNSGIILSPIEKDPLTGDGRVLTNTKTARDNAAVSGWGLNKVSLERILKEFKFTDALLQISFIQAITGIGTISTSAPFSLNINTGTQASSGARITTKQNLVHPVGEGLILKVLSIFTGGGIAGNQRSFGLFNDNNGYFLRLNGTALEFVTRNNGVDTAIDSSTWDIQPIIDDKAHIWDIQLQGLGVGDIYIFQDGKLLHKIDNIGVVTTTQTQQTDLPLRIVNENIANTSDVALQVSGVSISTEGEEHVRITDGKREVGVNLQNRLLTQGSGAALMDEPFDQPLDIVTRWQPVIVGSATYTQPVNTYTLLLAVTTAATDSVTLTFRENNLRETIGGFCQFEIGAKFGTTLVANNRREWGYLDSTEQNGMFFRVEGTGLDFVIVKAGVESVTSIDNSLPNKDFHLYQIQQLGAGKIAAFIDNKQVVDFAPAATSQVGSAEKKPFVKMYNIATLTSIPTDSEFHWIRLLDESGNRVTIVGKDENNAFRSVAVTTTGRLLTSSEPETAVLSDTQFDSVANVSDSFTIIPNGESVVIKTLLAGAESGNGGSKVELYEAPNGNTTGLIFIGVLFVDASNGQADLNYTTEIGDGTRAILLRRERFGGGAVEIYASFSATDK
jgi:hypothetical protein